MDLKRLAVCLSLGQELYGSDGTVITQTPAPAQCQE